MSNCVTKTLLCMKHLWGYRGCVGILLSVGSVFWLLLPSAAYADALVQVVEMVWTSAVTDAKHPEQRYETGTAPAQSPLCMWTTIRGDQNALERLKTTGKLTIIHKWTYKHLRWQTERIDVSIGRDAPLDAETLQNLAYEVAMKGYFDWRTWSKKDVVAPIAYTVTVVDAFDDPIDCKADPGCERQITVAPK